jgi:hypothetical protein
MASTSTSTAASPNGVASTPLGGATATGTSAGSGSSGGHGHWRDDANVSQLLEEAKACEQLGDYNDALLIYSHVAAMRPTDRWIHHHLASCRRELKEELLATGLYYKQERIISSAHRIGSHTIQRD